MSGSVNAEIRAALKDDKRVSVAISSGTTNQGLKLLIGAAERHKGQSKEEKGGSSGSERRKTPLTPREVQILGFIARGLHNRQIAARIHRSIKTVEKHRQNLHSKLSTHEVAGLTRQALALGVMDKTQKSSRQLTKSAARLTPRELEVLKLVAQGSGNKWIASELGRSIKTIDHHRENIMRKLGIHEVAGLTRHAMAIGLIGLL